MIATLIVLQSGGVLHAPSPREARDDDCTGVVWRGCLVYIAINALPFVAYNAVPRDLLAIAWLTGGPFSFACAGAFHSSPRYPQARPAQRLFLFLVHPCTVHSCEASFALPCPSRHKHA